MTDGKGAWTLSHRQHSARYQRAELHVDCEGVFRITRDDGRVPAEATCDVCGDVIGVPQRTLQAGPPAAETQSIPF